MLVFSRRVGEKIVIPGMNVSISMERIEGSRVVLGIHAPREVSIRRAELKPLTANEKIKRNMQKLPSSTVSASTVSP